MNKSHDDFEIGVDISIDSFLDVLNSLSNNEQKMMIVRFGMEYDKPPEEWIKKSIEETAHICKRPVQQVRQVEGKMFRKLKTY